MAPPRTPKLGPPVSMNRNVGSAPPPSPTSAGAELTTECYTYIAKPSTDGKSAILYNADRQEARITLELEGAGPVSVGTKQQLLPVLGGNGTLLTTGQEWSRTLAKGNKLYIAASTLSRIKVTIEPIPWAEQILGVIKKGLGA